MNADEKAREIVRDFASKHYHPAKLMADIATAITEAEKAALERGWQDISTAPKDGTLIWVLWDGHNNQTGEPARYYYAAFFDGDAEYEDLAWVDCEGHQIDEPTHWMPLPPPPSTTGNEETRG